MVQHVNTNDFEEVILNHDGVSVVDFWAEWCGPCKMIGPIFEEISNELTDIKFAKVNVDENSALSGEYGVRSIPTLLIIKDGKVAETLVGFMPKDQLKSKIEKHI